MEMEVDVGGCLCPLHQGGGGCCQAEDRGLSGRALRAGEEEADPLTGKAGAWSSGGVGGRPSEG